MTARLVRTEIEVPGTPEEVWEAIATGRAAREETDWRAWMDAHVWAAV